MMKKLLTFVAIIALTLILVACNKPQQTTPEPPEPTETIEVVDEEDEVDENEGTEDVAEETEEGSDEENSTVETNTEPAQQEDLWDKPDKIENMEHLEIVHLAYDIFAAQDRKDYSFLESVASKGTTVDRNKNKFKFENVTYPYEMNFFTKEEIGTLEFRYTHEEDGDVYVGFGAINYEEESSFVFELIFTKEDGKWKMRSMDINK